MAEERIIDDEYGRGIKLRKTKDGYVDATDELVADRETEEEEVSFEFPMIETEEDDEDLVGLSPEEALALKRKKIEAAERRRAEYEQTVQEGNALLQEEKYEEAERKFEEALNLDEIATDASVGYWRAKTHNFQNPDVLAEEYIKSGIESLEYDLGIDATYIIKQEHKADFEKRFKELEEEELPLAEEVEGKQQKRREVLKARLIKSTIKFAVACLPFLAFLICTIVFATKIPTVADNRFIPWTIGFGGATFIGFIIALGFGNGFKNACKIYRKNEKLSSTEEGVRLLEIRAYKALYLALLTEEEEKTEEKDEE